MKTLGFRGEKSARKRNRTWKLTWTRGEGGGGCGGEAGQQKGVVALGKGVTKKKGKYSSGRGREYVCWKDRIKGEENVWVRTVAMRRKEKRTTVCAQGPGKKDGPPPTFTEGGGADPMRKKKKPNCLSKSAQICRWARKGGRSTGKKTSSYPGGRKGNLSTSFTNKGGGGRPPGGERKQNLES